MRGRTRTLQLRQRGLTYAVLLLECKWPSRRSNEPCMNRARCIENGLRHGSHVRGMRTRGAHLRRRIDQFLRLRRAQEARQARKLGRWFAAESIEGDETHAIPRLLEQMIVSCGPILQPVA